MAKKNKVATEVLQNWKGGKLTGVLAENKLELTVDKKKQPIIKGSIIVKIATGKVEFNVYVSQTKLDGTETKTWKGWKTILEEYTSMVDDPDNADTITVSFTIENNDYVSDKDGKMKSGLRYKAFSATRNSNDPENYFEIEGVIKSIKPEEKYDKETESLVETDRTVVEFVSAVANADEGSRAEVFNLILENVEDDNEESGFISADEFEDFYEEGDTVTIMTEIVVKHVGGQKRTGGIGKQRTRGYDVVELVVVGGEEPYDEENDKYIDEDTLKTLLKERQMYLDAKMAEAGGETKSNKPTSGLGTKRKPSGKKELPF